jgi:hypothetical protein
MVVDQESFIDLNLTHGAIADGYKSPLIRIEGRENADKDVELHGTSRMVRTGIGTY